MSIQDCFALGDDFSATGIRFCDVNGIKHLSVLDVIKEITSVDAKHVWHRLKSVHSEVTSMAKAHVFSTAVGGGRETPVADAEVLLQIIFVVPGRRAAEFRKSGAVTLLKALNPDPDFIEQLQRRLEAAPGAVDLPLVNDNTKAVYLAARHYGATHLYVRIRLPAEYIIDGLVNPKQLTLSLIKFGITYDLNDRSVTYQKDPDNGFMVYAYTLCERQQAEAVEYMIKAEFSALAVVGRPRGREGHRRGRRGGRGARG
jgi:hypothetical protein